MPKTKPVRLTEVDRSALGRAIEAVRQRGTEDAQQLDWMVEQQGWRTAAEFASYSMQTRMLGLRPWQSPPCEVDPDFDGDDFHGRRTAARLLKRLLDAGLSRFEPDPIAALAAAERAHEAAE
jgi:hypothetical protein